jgi:guanyl-specific ribonuclease Sa
VAAGTTAILLVLGLNRAAQALVVVPRAIAAGIPFAPEKDGTVFGASWFSRSAGREG